MKCPICDEELAGTESCCPTCTWDLRRKPSALLLVVIGLVISGVVLFLGVRFARLIRDKPTVNASIKTDEVINLNTSTNTLLSQQVATNQYVHCDMMNVISNSILNVPLITSRLVHHQI